MIHWFPLWYYQAQTHGAHPESGGPTSHCCSTGTLSAAFDTDRKDDRKINHFHEGLRYEMRKLHSDTAKTKKNTSVPLRTTSEWRSSTTCVWKSCEGQHSSRASHYEDMQSDVPLQGHNERDTTCPRSTCHISVIQQEHAAQTAAECPSSVIWTGLQSNTSCLLIRVRTRTRH